MEKSKAYLISKKLTEATTAEELSKMLVEFGFSSTYLTLGDKENKLEEIRESIQDEESAISINSDTHTTQFWNKNAYTLDDLYLVRASDVFCINNLLTTPKDGQVLSHSDFDFHANQVAKKAVGLGETYEYSDYMAKKDEINKIQDSITPYLRQYRSTKHFTVNTLVSDNSGGSWKNMPYVYISKILPHLQDKNLASIAPHDTFFRGDVQLDHPTFMVQKHYLMDLITQNNPEILQTLMDCDIVLLDDNCHENGSPSAHVAYILREMKGAPYYYCHDHGVNIPSRAGVYKNLASFAEEHHIPYGHDHFYTKEKKMDQLHFMRNIAEDAYSYLAFVRDNPRLNLSDTQKEIIDNALNNYHETCQNAREKGIPLDFTEDTTPCADYEYIQSQNGNSEYDKSFRIFTHLSSIIDNAFNDSQFYETADISILAEETEKYNDEYKKTLESGAEYSRGKFYKPEIESSKN